MNAYQKAFIRTVAKQLTVLCLVTAIVTVSWVLGIHAYFSERISAAASLTIAYVICLVPVYKQRMWLLFTNRPFRGTVVDIKHTETRVNNMNSLNSFFMLRTVAIKPMYIMTLTVRGDSGKITIKRVERGSVFMADEWYQIGDRVIFYRGTKFPLIVGHTPFCAWCGGPILEDGVTCHDCGKINDFSEI